MKKSISIVLLLILILFGYSCRKNEDETNNIDKQLSEKYPFNKVYYEIFVRSFQDSDNDSIGDLNGITNKLDYLEELGVKGIWLTPIHPSVSYHGYDVLDFYQINSEYGTLSDLENLIKEARLRDIDIIMDLVMNHSADTHPWFLDAISDVNSKYRDYYFDNGKYPDKTFVGSMIDFNWKSPLVMEEFKKIVKFYLDLGISGFRVDAAKHLMERDIDSRLKLNELNVYIKSQNKNAFFISEVNTSGLDITSNYLKVMDSTFNFYLKDKLVQVSKGMSTNSLSSELNYVYNYMSNYNPKFIDAPFINNHDIDRFASQVQGSLSKQKLAISILLTLPGAPFVYYGEEIGMFGRRLEGVNVPNYGIVYDEYRRSPFVTNKYKSSWLPNDIDNKNIVPLEIQLLDENSLVNYYKALINLRNKTFALRYGNTFKQVTINNKLQAYERTFIDESLGVEQRVLIIHNISSETQIIENIEYKNILFGSLELGTLQTLILEL